MTDKYLRDEPIEEKEDAPSEVSGQINITNLSEDTSDAIFGNIVSGDLNYAPQYTKITQAEILLRQNISAIAGRESVPPSNLDSLLRTLEQHRLVLLEAPEQWGRQYVAAALAKLMLLKLPSDALDEGNENDEEATVWSKYADVSSTTIVEALVSQTIDVEDDETHIHNGVVYIQDVTPESYTPDIQERLRTLAHQQNLYIILTTRVLKGNWDNIWPATKPGFFSLPDVAPYTNEDLAQWACNVLNDSPGALERLWQEQIIDADIRLIEPTTILQHVGEDGGNLPLTTFVEEVSFTPSAINSLPNSILHMEHPNTLIQQIRTEIENADRRLEDWFAELEDPERYLVLTISLIENLPEYTFWAVYELLIDQYWRKRHRDLSMSDYLSLERSLSPFIKIQDGQIQVQEDVQNRIIEYALSSYRRSLVNALPFIANLLVIMDIQPDLTSSQLGESIVMLEIWGSDLAPRAESRERRDDLRKKLVTSIADMDKYTPATTEHILQRWAELPIYTYGNQEVELEQVFPRKQAFADVFLQMMLRDGQNREDESFWHSKRGLQLLASWYDTLKTEGAIHSPQDYRRQAIRQTLAFTIEAMAPGMKPKDFGTLADAEELLQNIPAEQPSSSELKSLFHMLVAYAWEADYRVRLVVADMVNLLAEKYPKEFAALVTLLAGDWRIEVRLSIVNTLWLNYKQEERQSRWVLQLINNLFHALPNTLMRRKVEKGHYLYEEARGTETLEHMYHHWTATLVMFYIGTEDKDVFRTYLNTLLIDEKSDAFKAYRSVLGFLVPLDLATEQGKKLNDDSPLKHIKSVFSLILQERAYDRRMSPAAKLLMERLGGQVKKYLSNDKIEELQQTDDIVAMRKAELQGV